MYDATIGRFFSEDPIGLDGGDPNLYRYVGNDPVGEEDPSGLKLVFRHQPGGTLVVEYLAPESWWPTENPRNPVFVGYATTKFNYVEREGRYISGAKLTAKDKEEPGWSSEEWANWIAQNGTIENPDAPGIYTPAQLINKELEFLGLKRLQDLTSNLPYEVIHPYIQDAIKRGEMCGFRFGDNRATLYRIRVKLCSGAHVYLWVVQAGFGLWTTDAYHVIGSDDGTVNFDDICQSFRDTSTEQVWHNRREMVPILGTYQRSCEGKFQEAAISAAFDITLFARFLGLPGKLATALFRAGIALKGFQALYDLFKGNYNQATWNVLEALLLLAAARTIKGYRADKACAARVSQAVNRIRAAAPVPKINKTHIFQGEINKSGKPVGFHHRPSGKNPANAKVTSSQMQRMRRVCIVGRWRFSTPRQALGRVKAPSQLSFPMHGQKAKWFPKSKALFRTVL